MKLTKIYTKTGDKGSTSLVGGIRISKASARLEAYGTVDELSSHIGLLVAHIEAMPDNDSRQQIIDDLELIQSALFNVGTYLATDTTQTPVYESAKLPLDIITHIEDAIDDMLPQLPMLDSFILPGGNLTAAQCHVSRTVCRRAERCVVTLAEEAEIQPEMLQFLNRISDYLFVLARFLNFIYNSGEKKWKKTCR